MNLKDWIFNNLKWILTMVVIGVANYYLMANKIDANSRGLQLKIDRDEAKELIDTKVRDIFETELNHYFSDTDGQVLKKQVENLEVQIDRLEKILERIKR